MQSVRKEEESSKPRSNMDKDSKSKGTSNASERDQRTVKIDSSLTGATEYIRKQKEYSQNKSEKHQEKETETRNRDLYASLVPK